MRTSDMIKSNYISKAEVKAAGALILTIVGCTLEKVGSDDKWVLWFNEHPKGITLNNTKIKLLEAAYGDDSDYWVHRRVRLTYDPTVMMSGQVVGGIKLACSTQPTHAHAPGVARSGANLPPPATSGRPGPPAPPGAPPAPVWDGTRWVTQEPTFDQATGEIYPPPSARPQTISERVNQAHPPAGQPAAAPEFDDDIPF